MNLAVFSSLHDSIDALSLEFSHLFFFLPCVSNICWTLATAASSLTCALFAFFHGHQITPAFGMEIAAVCTVKIPFHGTVSSEGQQSVKHIAI